MEAAAATRKEKLVALRKRKADEDAGVVPRGPVKLRAGDDVDGDEEMDEGLLVKRSFRNYDPQNRQFKKTAAGQDIEDTVEKGVLPAKDCV
jgi:coiled-coil domain-containing protein 12